MSVLAVVPARAGSKGMPDKNVAPFRGRPLLVHSIEHGLAAANVDRVLVSTDSPRYQAIARGAGAEAPFLRPAALAGDLSTDLEVFAHALEWLERHEDYRPEACVHLRPTYPTRTVADVEKAVALLLRDPGADCVRSVSVAPHTPFKMWRRAEDGTLRPLLQGPPAEPWSLPRQALPVVYIQNAAVDVIRTAVIRVGRSMTGTRVLPYLMDRFHDVDDWSGLAAAEREFHPAEMPTGRTFAFDLDGVIATLVPGNEYLEAEPFLPAVALVNRLHAAGNRILVYTARGSLTGIDWAEATAQQLRRWGVRYHEVRFGKPAADYYVDDRMISLATLLAWVDEAAPRPERKHA